MDFNICIVQPPGYIHTGAFTELAELVFHGLRDAGYNVTIGNNHIAPAARNILIGCHLLGPGNLGSLPPDTIILNTEQIHRDVAGWGPTIMSYASRFELWDYSTRNLEQIRQLPGAHARLLPIGFHSALRRIPNARVQDIDVLFYGSMNERRHRVVEKLRNAGVNVKVLFGVYGTERDNMIARSKIVLNVHYYPTLIFEIVRVFYLMINSKAVVSEVGTGTSISPPYLEGILSTTYDQIASSCQALLGDERLRRDVEQRSFETIKRLPQGELMSRMLAS